MHRQISAGIPYYTFEHMANAGLRHAIFTRKGGVSPAPFDSLNHSISTGDTLANVQRNRELALAALGITPDRLATVWQVHGINVLALQAPCDVNAQADALITQTPGLALTLRFADCTPILLYDPRQRAIGMAHAGWRGTVEGMVQAAVKAMQTQYNTNPADLLAGIGPSIGASVYAVGLDVQHAVTRAFPNADNLLQRRDGQVYFDLWEANASALRACGVQNIEVAGICTYQNATEFFSHRASGPHTGRFAAVAILD